MTYIQTLTVSFPEQNIQLIHNLQVPELQHSNKAPSVLEWPIDMQESHDKLGKSHDIYHDKSRESYSPSCWYKLSSSTM